MSFDPLHFIEDVSQEQIAACPTVTGMDPANCDAIGLPPQVFNAVRHMPWTRARKHRQVLIRPQDCMGVDTRLGTFWHRDVDVHGIVTPTWDDLILTIVSFGGIAETEFIPTAVPLAIWPPPSLGCYTDELAQHVNGKGWPAVSASPCQVVRYRSTDWHRAGHIRKHGLRLVIIGIESDHLEPRGGVA